MRHDVVDLFLDRDATDPAHPAIEQNGTSVTYGALARRVRAFAQAFSKFEPPRILIALPRVPDAYAAIFASGLSGAIIRRSISKRRSQSFSASQGCLSRTSFLVKGNAPRRSDRRRRKRSF
jgi:acyl-coenzyme A synthetase/AMP-(fatty) acid ligase